MASLAGIAAQVGYKRRPGRYGGKPAVVAENRLEQNFEVSAPDQIWGIDITQIRTPEGWLYLCVFIDVLSRSAVGWSVQSRMTTDLALQALLMAVWRRTPDVQVMVHSDQRFQFASRDRQAVFCQPNPDPSMSRHGTCHDTAVAESIFQLLKRDRIRRRSCPSRDNAGQDLFEHTELFQNPRRKHTNNRILSPPLTRALHALPAIVDFENRQQELNPAGI